MIQEPSPTDNLYSVNIKGKNINFQSDEDYFKNQWLDIESGKLEPLTFNIFTDYIHNDGIFIDIGAYIGYTTLYGSLLAKKAYAFEPDPIAFEHLRLNLLSNPNITNLDIYNEAIGAEEGKVNIKSTAHGGNSGSSILINDYKSSWEVKLTNIISFLDKVHTNEPIFIKMDIEGYEYILLPKIINLLKEHKPTLFLSIHPQIIANSVNGNNLISKIKRRLKMINLHKSLTESLSIFPYCKKSNGDNYSLNDLMNNIKNKGILEDDDKDLLLHF